MRKIGLTKKIKRLAVVFAVLFSLSLHAETVVIASQYKAGMKVKKCGQSSHANFEYIFLDADGMFDVSQPDASSPDGFVDYANVSEFITKNNRKYHMVIPASRFYYMANTICHTSVALVKPAAPVIVVKLNKKRNAAVLIGEVKVKGYDVLRNRPIAAVYTYKGKGPVTIAP